MCVSNLELFSKPDEQRLFVPRVNVFAYTDTALSEHDIHKLHCCMLDWVGCLNTHSSRFVILVEENILQMPQGSSMVLRFEALQKWKKGYFRLNKHV